jgi:hypothetical protein
MNGYFFARNAKKLNPSSKIEQRMFGTTVSNKAEGLVVSFFKSKNTSTINSEGTMGVLDNLTESSQRNLKKTPTVQYQCHMSGGIGKIFALYGCCSPADYETNRLNWTSFCKDVMDRDQKHPRKNYNDFRNIVRTHQKNIKTPHHLSTKIDIKKKPENLKKISESLQKKIKDGLVIPVVISNDGTTIYTYHRKNDHSKKGVDDKILLKRIPMFNSSNSPYSVGNIAKQACLWGGDVFCQRVDLTVEKTTTYASLSVFDTYNEHHLKLSVYFEDTTNETVDSSCFEFLERGYNLKSEIDYCIFNNMATISHIVEKCCENSNIFVPNVYFDDMNTPYLKMKYKEDDYVFKCDFDTIETAVDRIKKYKKNVDVFNISDKIILKGKKKSTNSVHEKNGNVRKNTDTKYVICVDKYNGCLFFDNERPQKTDNVDRIVVKRNDLSVCCSLFYKKKTFHDAYDRTVRYGKKLVEKKKDIVAMSQFVDRIEHMSNESVQNYFGNIISLTMTNVKNGFTIRLHVGLREKAQTILLLFKKLNAIMVSDNSYNVLEIEYVVSTNMDAYCNERAYWQSDTEYLNGPKKIGHIIPSNTASSIFLFEQLSYGAFGNIPKRYDLSNFANQCLKVIPGGCEFTHCRSKLERLVGYLENLNRLVRRFKLLQTFLNEYGCFFCDESMILLHDRLENEEVMFKTNMLREYNEDNALATILKTLKTIRHMMAQIELSDFFFKKSF